MLKTLNVVLVGLMLGGAGVVYMMKYDSERAAARIGKLQQKIVSERQEIAGLRAEWSLLNQPKRLQELVEKYRSYLDLQELDPNQVATIDEIPFRTSATPDAAKPDAAKPDAAKAHGRMLALGKAGDLTGSLPKPSADRQVKKSADKLDTLAAPKTVEPRANDPINAIIR